MSPSDRRHRLETQDRLSVPLRAYTTASESAAVDKLVAVYRSRSNVARHALAALIRIKHPELASFLRKDLDTL